MRLEMSVGSRGRNRNGHAAQFYIFPASLEQAEGLKSKDAKLLLLYCTRASYYVAVLQATQSQSDETVAITQIGCAYVSPRGFGFHGKSKAQDERLAAL